MPGPVSDSYDPEFGTGDNAASVREAVQDAYAKLTKIIGVIRPIYIVDLAKADLPRIIQAELTEREWRILRFCCERAEESL